MVRTAILTVSDGPGGPGAEATAGTAGTANVPVPAPEASQALAAVRARLGEGPFEEVDHLVVPLEQAIIRAKLRVWCDSSAADLILTTGGDGLGLRDRTPEATTEVVEREIPGLAELMRVAGIRETRSAALSRGVAGVRNATLIVNLPTRAAAVRVALGAILPVLPEAVSALRASPLGGAGH